MGAAVVATDHANEASIRSARGLPTVPATGLKFGSITLAALALPGIYAPAALADEPPEFGVVSAKVQTYNDWQPGLDRIKVTAPALYVAAPFASHWSIETTLVQDSVSGASPRWHSSISGASRMQDRRNAADVKLSRYFDRATLAMRASTSDEDDYQSNAVAMEARFSSSDNNTTWSFGVGLTRDKINPVNELVVNEKKRVTEAMIGVTRAWTKNDLVQLNLSHVRGRGYYDDPYKLADQRPRARNQTIALLRWNHFHEASETTLRSSYRYYTDSFGVKAHTWQAEWVKPLGDRFAVTPSARYYTQRAASFFFDPIYDPVIGEPFPPGQPKYLSADARLSSFGSITLGMRLDWRIDSRWSADVKYERYEQRGKWRLGGNGSFGLAPFRAQMWQLGVTRTF